MSDSLDFRIVGEEEAPLNLKDVASEGRLYYNSDTGKFVKKRQIGVGWDYVKGSNISSENTPGTAHSLFSGFFKGVTEPLAVGLPKGIALADEYLGSRDKDFSFTSRLGINEEQLGTKEEEIDEPEPSDFRNHWAYEIGQNNQEFLDYYLAADTEVPGYEIAHATGQIGSFFVPGVLFAKTAGLVSKGAGATASAVAATGAISLTGHGGLAG